MATNPDFLNYLVQQIRCPQPIRTLKMMGEYCVYYDNKVVALVCDNQLFMKDTTAGRAYLGAVELAPAYPGSKPFLLIDDLEDHEKLSRLVEITAAALPLPKPKKPKLKSR